MFHFMNFFIYIRCKKAETMRFETSYLFAFKYLLNISWSFALGNPQPKCRERKRRCFASLALRKKRRAAFCPNQLAVLVIIFAKGPLVPDPWDTHFAFRVSLGQQVLYVAGRPASRSMIYLWSMTPSTLGEEKEAVVSFSSPTPGVLNTMYKEKSKHPAASVEHSSLKLLTNSSPKKMHPFRSLHCQ